jgi:hypothetical protein
MKTAMVDFLSALMFQKIKDLLSSSKISKDTSLFSSSRDSKQQQHNHILPASSLIRYAVSQSSSPEEGKRSLLA